MSCRPGRYVLARPVGAVNLTMPLATWLGLSDAPGHATGYGPLDAADSRDLAARLAGQRGGRWCITLTGEGGRAVAHGCARTGPAPAGRSRPPPRGSRQSRVSRAGGQTCECNLAPIDRQNNTRKVERG
jgi:hypothetical protein